MLLVGCAMRAIGVEPHPSKMAFFAADTAGLLAGLRTFLHRGQSHWLQSEDITYLSEVTLVSTVATGLLFTIRAFLGEFVSL